jgi:hypothetical protein
MGDKQVFVAISRTKSTAEVKGGYATLLERWFWGFVAVAVLVSGLLKVSSALGETQTWDEGIHISAGYAYLTHGDYRWNPEHPPLAKLVSALPLTLLGLELPVRGTAWAQQDETLMGIDFLYRNRASADSILAASRGMTILLSVLFLAGIAWWTRRRFGTSTALLTVFLCAFDPNLIAHGRYVTTDFPVSVFYFFAAVLWTDYLVSGRFRDLMFAALAFALAMVTKFSAILLIPTLIVLYAIRWVRAPREFPIKRAASAVAALGGMTVIAVSVVYWPETLRCLTTNVPRLAQLVNRENLVGVILYRMGRWFHLPAHPYLVGLGKVAEHNVGGHPGYLLGMRSDKGWWYYFPVVFAVKSTIAALVATAFLAAAGIRAILTRIPHQDRGADSQSATPRLVSALFLWCGLLIPPAIYFLFSMTSAIDIGMRHILPMYPFLYVAAAALLSLALPRKAAMFAMIGLGLLQIGECASIAPDYLAFFNAVSGGPGNGPRYLVDSNIDWGQDVKKLKAWLEAHGARAAYINYFGNAEMPYYGVRAKNFPQPMDEKGWDDMDDFAIASVTPLYGVYVPLNELTRLRLREPIAKIGWSMYVYDLRKGRPH